MSQISRRIYPLDPRELTEEQIAVVFAMTSRNPESFDNIAKIVSAEKAANFHERWVLNYGHASVAEHAILHMAVENISRLACDTLEDNRLASYTEKSSRYQLLARGHYYIPQEIKPGREMNLYTGTCDYLFQTYEEILDGLLVHLANITPRGSEERSASYNLRLRRVATDSCRFLLPAATLTNVGVTMNARSMEHAVRKLLSSNLIEEQEIGEALKGQGRTITPTLIKYADRNEYLVVTRDAQDLIQAPQSLSTSYSECQANLVHSDPLAQSKLVSALMYRFSSQTYEQIWETVQSMDDSQMEEIIDQCLNKLGPHDIPIRELETVDYSFDMVMDYGAYREFKRHRMQTYIAQPLTTNLGFVVPELIQEAGLEQSFSNAMEKSNEGFKALAESLPEVAQYLVTHAHLRRSLCKINLRECYHLFKLRTSPQAHFTLRRVMNQALNLVTERHPLLFKYLKIRTD